MSNKTEAPTPKRLRRSREDGEIAKSTHLTVAFSGLCWWLYLFIEAPHLYALGSALILHVTTLDTARPFGDRLASTLTALGAFLQPALVALGVGWIAVLVPE